MNDLEQYKREHPELWELECLENYLGNLPEGETDETAEQRYYELDEKRNNGTIK